MGTPRAAELGGLSVPATDLDAGDRDGDGLVRRGQDAQVEDTVLLSADQFLPVEQQHRQVAQVDEAQLRNMPRLRDLRDPGAAVGQCLIQEPLARLSQSFGQEREEA